MAPQTNPTPASNQAFYSSDSKPRSPLVVVVVIILLLLAVLIAVGLKKSINKGPVDDGGQEQTNQLSEAEKQQLLASLARNSSTTPLTEGEKKQLLNSLKTNSTATKPLTEAEKAQLLKSLQQ